MKKKTDTLTLEEMREIMKTLDRLKVWEFIVTFMKIWPFITIERANIIRVGENTMGKTINDMVKKELKK